MQKTLGVGILILLATLLGSGLRAAEHYVTNTNDDGDGSLRYWLESSHSQPKDTIIIDKDHLGEVNNTIVLNSALCVGAPINIDASNFNDSEGNPGFNLVGNGCRIFIFDSKDMHQEWFRSMFKGLIIKNGNADWGGGIYVESGKLGLSNCWIVNNTAKNGGGICISGNDCEVVLLDCVVSGNKAEDGNKTNRTAGGCGGGIYNNGFLHFLGKVDIINNDAGKGGGNGGGIYNNYQLTSYANTTCTISYNNAGAGWGQKWSKSDLAPTVGGSGGGIYSTDSEYASLHLLNATISHNSAGNGGSWDGYHTKAQNNNGGNGGGIASYTFLTYIANCTFSDNKAGYAGARYSNGGYGQGGSGGGLYLMADCPTIQDIACCKFKNNSAGDGSWVQLGKGGRGGDGGGLCSLEDESFSNSFEGANEPGTGGKTRNKPNPTGTNGNGKDGHWHYK